MSAFHYKNKASNIQIKEQSLLCMLSGCRCYIHNTLSDINTAEMHTGK